MTGPQHYAEAQQAITASTYSYQRWGAEDGTEDAYWAAEWEMRRAQVHATLALAAATVQPHITTGTLTQGEIEDWQAAMDPAAP